MNYGKIFALALSALKEEGRYRVFANIKRERGRFPYAQYSAPEGPRPITVWCSNDYLCMG